MKMNKTRKPAVAGSFYPENKGELLLLLKSFFDETKQVSLDKKIQALIVPHAGYVYSGHTAAWGYRQLPPKLNKPHFVLIGPSHSYYFTGLVSSADGNWETPLGKISCQKATEVGKEININDEPHLTEHSLEVQLPFLQSLYDQFSISAFLTGDQINYSDAAQYFLKNYSSSIFIISSDLSHYLPESEARKKDKKTIEEILKLKTEYLLSVDNAACGSRGILILLEMAKIKKWQPKLFYNDTSATCSGDISKVVGYASIGFYA
jgi:AmmeMemoRadiSam system protein B